MFGPIVHVLGARPNFVKAAPVIEALCGVDQAVIHTGQHYGEHGKAGPRIADVIVRHLG